MSTISTAASSSHHQLTVDQRPDVRKNGSAINSRALAEFARYGFVSLVGLVVDFVVLWIQVRVFGIVPLWASPAAFMTGLMVVYVLSITWVFREKRVSSGSTEFVVFALLGLVGLSVTQCVMYVGTSALHINFLLVKLVAAGMSFSANFLARKAALFSSEGNHV